MSIIRLRLSLSFNKIYSIYLGDRMRIRTKALLFSSVLAAASVGTLMYGNHRFNSSRYQPQCEHLPDECIYGRQKMQLVNYTWEKEGFLERASETRKLSLCSSGGCTNFSVDYYKNRSVIWVSNEGHHCYTKPGQGQLVMSSVFGDPVLSVRGCEYGIFDRQTYEIPLLGLRDIFDPLEPITITYSPLPEKGVPQRCQDYYAYLEKRAQQRRAEQEQQKVEIKIKRRKTMPQKRQKQAKQIKQEPPPFSSSEESFCYLEKRLRDAEPQTEDEKFKLRLARFILLQKADEFGIWSDEFDKAWPNASFILNEIDENRNRDQATVTQPEQPFWRGWDWLFGAGLFSPLFVCFIGLTRKIWKKTKQWRIEHMEEKEAEKNRKLVELRKIYYDKMEELYPRLEKAQTLEECYEIRREYGRLIHKTSDEVIRKLDEKWAKELRMESAWFLNTLDATIEYLGGIKAIHRRA